MIKTFDDFLEMLVVHVEDRPFWNLMEEKGFAKLHINSEPSDILNRLMKSEE